MDLGRFLRKASRTHVSRKRAHAARFAMPALFESLEERTLLTVTLDPISNLTIPGSKFVVVPITASTDNGRSLSYSASVVTSTGVFVPNFITSNTFLKVSVAGFGDMTFALFNSITPNTVSTITGLVNQNFYNHLTFHRIVQNFAIQGGDPNGDGTGGPGFKFNDELDTRLTFTGDGQLALANSGPDTNGSQFFISQGAQRSLDFGYTIFGQLIRGFNVRDAIAATPVGPQSSGGENSKPNTPVVITSASIVTDNTDAVLLVAGQAGKTATIRVTADDGAGSTSSQNFNLTAITDTVTDPPFLATVNGQPVALPIPNISTPFNTAATVPITANNLSGAPGYQAIELVGAGFDSVAHATVTVNGSNVVVTPNAGYVGLVHVLVGVPQNNSSHPFDTQSFIVSVGQSTTTTTLAPLTSATAGQNVTFTATVTSSAGQPTGTVTFKDGTAVLGTGNLNASGQASFTTNTLAGGLHSITAVYGGDATNAGSTSAAATQSIGAATHTTVVASVNPADPGQSVTFTATVAPNVNNATALTGTIAFMNGTGLLANVPVSGSRQATYTIASLSPGVHNITAVYSGDNTFGSSTSPNLVSTVNHPPATIITGPDAGSPPLVKVFDAATGTVKFSFLAYNADFLGSVRVASGDVNGDGVADIITSTGPGGLPLVNVYDGKTSTLIGNFYAYVPAYIGGVEITVADVKGTGVPQIITSTDAGGQPLVNVFDFTGTLLKNFFAYDPNYIGGVRIAAGDVNGDGKADIATATAAGGLPLVNVFDGLTGTLLGNFYGQALTYLNGFRIATGDVNGDGTPDIIISADAGAAPEVRIYDGVGKTLIRSFNAYSAGFLGGVRVAAADVNGDGKADIITVPGPGGSPEIRIFDGTNGTQFASFFAYDSSVLTGTFISAS